ncbi:hypothetical protein [Paenibacillus lautus]|uniref:hypothetical protein n=1 Tax=Paenibacillus lautus TaxID=1401 RepID=UPI002DBECCB6|nr:hypothetical protein [Paenibacillus lautus]MEC0258388.1 hypothetical protein [Paenibacillus lautus]
MGRRFLSSSLAEIYSKVLMELPVDMKDKYQATAAVFPSHVFDDRVVTVVLPDYNESLSAFTLK